MYVYIMIQYNLHMYVHVIRKSTQCIYTFVPELLICIEAWAKLSQQWLACVPSGSHLTELTILVIIINNTIWP